MLYQSGRNPSMDLEVFISIIEMRIVVRNLEPQLLKRSLLCGPIVSLFMLESKDHGISLHRGRFLMVDYNVLTRWNVRTK